jgi:16S rRNA (cytidine1402-2'-O)-methyltransferase
VRGRSRAVGRRIAFRSILVRGIPAGPRSGQRRTRLEALAGMPATMIFYAPARDLSDNRHRYGHQCSARSRMATLARELTKLHETVHRAPLKPNSGQWIAADPDQQRGEAVLVVAGTSEPTPAVNPEALARELARELPPSRAAKVLARLTGMSRKEAWHEGID